MTTNNKQNCQVYFVIRFFYSLLMSLYSDNVKYFTLPILNNVFLLQSELLKKKIVQKTSTSCQQPAFATFTCACILDCGAIIALAKTEIILCTFPHKLPYSIPQLSEQRKLVQSIHSFGYDTNTRNGFDSIWNLLKMDAEFVVSCQYVN